MKTLKVLGIPLLLSVFILCASAMDASKETERMHSATNVLKDFSAMKAPSAEKAWLWLSWITANGATLYLLP
jgi:hypothetical protein